MLVTTPPAGAQPHGRTTKPGSPRGCGDRAGWGGARRQGWPRVPGPRDPRKERLGSYRDPNPASPARRLIQASRCQPPPGLAMEKPNRLCLGAEISGGLAFFQTSPANFTELPALGMEAGRNSSVGREPEPGGGHSCCFCSLCVCVSVSRFLLPWKKNLWRRAPRITPALFALSFQSRRGSAQPGRTGLWMSPRRASGGFIPGNTGDWGAVQGLAFAMPRVARLSCTRKHAYTKGERWNPQIPSSLNKSSLVGGKEGCRAPTCFIPLGIFVLLPFHCSFLLPAWPWYEMNSHLWKILILILELSRFPRPLFNLSSPRSRRWCVLVQTITGDELMYNNNNRNTSKFYFWIIRKITQNLVIRGTSMTFQCHTEALFYRSTQGPLNCLGKCTWVWRSYSLLVRPQTLAVGVKLYTLSSLSKGKHNLNVYGIIALCDFNQFCI